MNFIGFRCSTVNVDLLQEFMYAIFWHCRSPVQLLQSYRSQHNNKATTYNSAKPQNFISTTSTAQACEYFPICARYQHQPADVGSSNSGCVGIYDFYHCHLSLFYQTKNQKSKSNTYIRSFGSTTTTDLRNTSGLPRLVLLFYILKLEFRDLVCLSTGQFPKSNYLVQHLEALWHLKQI